MMKKAGVSKPVLGASSSSSRFSKRKSSSKKRSKTSRSSKKSPSITPDTQSEASETDFVGLLDPPMKSRFSAANFLKASRIIRSIKNPHLQVEERPVFSSDEERILTYELIVAILKYSSFLREALEKSSFYLRNPELQNVGQEELLVLLYDLIEREFRVSPEDPDLPDAFGELQAAIMDSKTKLMAHIAKLRIKHEASTLENLLPNNLRHQHNIDKNPLYFWINLKKVQMPKIVAALKQSGLQETRFEDDTLIQENLFSVSHLHPDLIRMHSSKANTITSMPMFRDGYIVVQDKSACIPPYVLAKALYFKEAIYHRGAGMENLNPFPNGESDIVAPAMEERYSTSEIAEEWYHGILEGPGKNFSKPDSVVVTHCGLGRSAAHLAILLAEAVPRYLSRSVNMSTTGTDLVKAIKSKFVYRPPLNVVVFGTPVNKHEEISKYIKKTLGVANIRLYSEDFINVHHKDSRIRGCGAILVNPPSSGSALKDPVTYICSEGGDEQVLTQFSEFVSSSTKDDNGNKVAYSPNQAKYLNHALSIPNVKLVMYTTCSNLACENTEVVRVCLNEARRKEETKKCKFYASMVVQSQSKMYKDVTFEIVNMTRLMEGYGDNCFQNNFVDMHPSSACSGVFMSLIRRRDRQINMAKNPVKQFVASHMQVKSSRTLSEWGEGDDEQLLSSGVPSLTNFSSVASLTEEELANYLIHKLNLDVTNEHELLESTSPSVPVFQANMKKKTSKKAIVKRVSIPTHSSLLRQKEKYLMNASYPSSGSQTPRTGRISSVVGISGERPDSSRPSTTHSIGSSLGCPNHIHQHGHTCVCARHAKKFPDLVKHI
ncbi:putative methyltransferase NSUN7 [Orchesella cincta]|uniref:Putative methyltransferase NSUN7 n=1 Tax=Orchesella cincta TaxID=48709 RepID=A0A1D2NAM7_ORCCI|nr:putative methyltransferase NSUN7 [Orchesella cincta]